MSLHRRAAKFKKNLAKFGDKNPGSTAHRIVALEGDDYRTILRRISAEASKKELFGLEKKFPVLSKSILRRPAHEWPGHLEEVQKLSPPEVEKLLSAGVKLSDLRYYTRGMLKEKNAFATKDKMNVFLNAGVSQQMARFYCYATKIYPAAEISKVVSLMFEKGFLLDGAKYSPDQMAKLTSQLREERSRANTVRFMHQNHLDFRALLLLLEATKKSPKQAGAFLDLLKSGTVISSSRDIFDKYGLFDGLVQAHGLEKAVEMAKGKKITLSKRTTHVKVVKKFYDYKRHGKPFYTFQTNFDQSAISSLLKKGISVFPCIVRGSRVASSNAVITKRRRVFYMEVPEFPNLLGIAGKMGRQHIKGSLAFADVEVHKSVLFIQELQTDLLRKLPAELQQKYSSWEKVLVLSIAAWADKNGISRVSIASPQLIKSIWEGEISKRVLQRTYYDVPSQLGFDLYKMHNNVQFFDSAFGRTMMGETNQLWYADVSLLKEKFPEFFLHS